MSALLGRILILAALAAAAGGTVAGVVAGKRGDPLARRWTWLLAYLYAGLMAAANLLMEAALLTPDFSVSYVAQVGSRSAPLWVRAVSLWSSLEGSILFWGLILGLFVFLLAWLERHRLPKQMPWALATVLTVGTFFSLLLAGPANPFHTLSPAPLDGPGPNPLLQNHILMVVHPPMLYLGYVGMSVPFALAVASLVTGELGREQLRPLRNWLLVAWTFLTLGIVLGGWWAYEVLGWGGYWAWDPVENASLLPWLTATAALHSLLVVERRGVLKAWSLTLVLASFLLTILGTFMTRSGVFNSVHAFSQSDIGPTFLGFLATLLVGSVVLLAARVGLLAPEGGLPPGASREGTFLLNNLLFVTLTLTVLLGTVFPLVVEAVRGVRMSVGEPYFNAMAVPLGVAILFLMGVGPALPWGTATGREAARALLPGSAAGLFAVGLGFALGARDGWLLAALFAGGFTLLVTLEQLVKPLRAGGSVSSLLGAGRRRSGSYVIHAGIVLALIGVAASSSGRVSIDATMKVGERAALGAYDVTFLGTQVENEPHRQSVIARFALSRDGKLIGELEPRMNYYAAMREPVGTPHVFTSLSEDVYLSVMSVHPEQALVGIRGFVNPMVVWIWIGGTLAALGALFALWPVRRRAAVPAARNTPEAPPVAPAREGLG